MKNAPDYEVATKMAAIIAKYIGRDEYPIDGYFETPYPQRLSKLYKTLILWVLREKGDIKEFLSMTKEIDKLPGREPSEKEYGLVKLIEWLRDSTMMFPYVLGFKPQMVLGFAAWGDYIDKARNNLFRTWLASDNIKHLCQHKRVIVHIITTETGKRKFNCSKNTQKLEELGVRFVYQIIPDEIIKTAEVYWILGACNSLHISYAKRFQAALHLTYPDLLYSNKYFSELLRLSKTHSNILMMCPPTDEGAMKNQISSYDIPAADLAAYALNAIHYSEFFSFVNSRPTIDSVPEKHILWWETEDVLYTSGIHANAAYICEKTLAKCEDRFYMTIDSELDFLCQGDDFYFPQEEDELFCCEMSNQSCRPIAEEYVLVKYYGEYLWKKVHMRDTMKFFLRGSATKINRKLRPDIKSIPKDEAIQQRKTLNNIIIGSDPWMGKPVPIKRTLVA